MLAPPSGRSPILVTIPTDRTPSNSAAHSVKASSHGGKVTRQRRTLALQPPASRSNASWTHSPITAGPLRAWPYRRRTWPTRGRLARRAPRRRTDASEQRFHQRADHNGIFCRHLCVGRRKRSGDRAANTRFATSRPLKLRWIAIIAQLGSLRGDPRFEAIVASLAPKEVH